MICFNPVGPRVLLNSNHVFQILLPNAFLTHLFCTFGRAHPMPRAATGEMRA